MADRPQHKRIALLLERIVSVQRGLDAKQRETLDRLLRHPEAMWAHLRPLVAADPPLGRVRFWRVLRGHHLSVVKFLRGRVAGEISWTLLPDVPGELPHRLTLDARLWRDGDALQTLLKVGRLRLFSSLWIGPAE